MNGELISRADLGRGDRASMCALMMRHYEGVSRGAFERDLSDKDYVIRITDGEGTLRGFTTFALVPVTFGGERIWTLYSGDTIVDPSARRSSALARTWIDSVRVLRDRLGGERLVWLLICSGPRTYRFLPVFFREFFPRFDRDTPPATERLVHTLASARYGRRYDGDTGIVQLANPTPLRALEHEGPGVPLDDHVACFLRRNPGHEAGDELVCFTELCDENLTRAGRRMAREGERRRAPGIDPGFEVAV